MFSWSYEVETYWCENHIYLVTQRRCPEPQLKCTYVSNNDLSNRALTVHLW